MGRPLNRPLSELATAVRAWRAERGVSREQLAELLDVLPDRIGELERDDTPAPRGLAAIGVMRLLESCDIEALRVAARAPATLRRTLAR